MKNKIITLFTLICTFFCLFICILLQSNSSVYADENKNVLLEEIVSKEALNLYISNTDVDKSAGSKGEEKTAAYLSKFLSEQGCSYYKDKTDFLTKFNVRFGVESSNVIGVKKSSIQTNKNILISAHYDNTYNKNDDMGALNNATGVVCLMSLIEKLKPLNFDFNLIYCFFGASDLNLSGSKAFVKSLTREDSKNLLLNINLDSIGCGEYNYYYAGDSANSFTKTFKFNDYNISSLPIYNKTYYFLTKDNQAYTNYALTSDNSSFLNNKIKSISFFSGNLNGINAGFKESSKHENISNTKLDNPVKLLEYYPNHMNKINSVANLIYNTLQNPSLVNNLEKSYKELDFSFFNNKFLIIALGIFGVFLLCGIKFKEKKKGEKNEQSKIN